MGSANMWMGIAVLRGLESERPADERILDDPVSLRLLPPVVLWLIYRGKNANSIKGLYPQIELSGYSPACRNGRQSKQGYDPVTRVCFYLDSIVMTTGR